MWEVNVSYVGKAVLVNLLNGKTLRGTPYAIDPDSGNIVLISTVRKNSLLTNIITISGLGK